MPAWLVGIPLWLWLVWVALVFLAAIVLAPRRKAERSRRNQRFLRILGQALLAIAIITVRAETAAVATLLAALGGAIYGNASGDAPGRRAPDGDASPDGDHDRPDMEDGDDPPR